LVLYFSLHRSRVRALLFVATLLPGVLPGIVPCVAQAQAALGPGDDAWTLPRGVSRIGIGTRFYSASEMFDSSGERVSLGSRLSGPLDATRLSALADAQTRFRDLLGSSPLQVSLGEARADVRLTGAIIPLNVGVGITSWLTLRATGRFVTGQQELNWSLDGETATFGLNPAITTPGALSTNGAIVSGLAGAALGLETLTNACVAGTSTDERCAGILDELNAVRALIADARRVSDALAATYGAGGEIPPALAVPLAGSAAQTTVALRIAALRAGFEHFATPSVGEGAAPVGAPAPLTISALTTLLSDSAYGYALGPFKRRYQQGFGDTDVGITLRLYDGLSARTPWSNVAGRQRGARVSVGATYRLGTGTPPNADDPLLVPTGDGQDDIEVFAAADAVLGRHFWTSVRAQYTQQRPVDRIQRIPDASGFPFIPLSRRRATHVEPGDRVTLEIMPRWLLNEYLAAGLKWTWSTQSETVMTELAPFAGTAPMAYTGPGMTMHEVGIGAAWSSVAAWRRRKAWLPVEVQWDHTLVVAGSGDVVRISGDRVALRVYVPLWGPPGRPPRR
jgi:hypothetical protein